MIGLVIVTHRDFASALLAAAEHVVGPLSQAAAISIADDDDMEARREDIAQAVANADSGDGVIVVTDLFGGTPSNLAISLMNPKVEVIAGVNLPMLIRFNGVRELPLAACAESLRDAGRKYISLARDILGPVPEEPMLRELAVDEEQQQRAGQSLTEVAADLVRLRLDLRATQSRLEAYPRIGHNLPPGGLTPEDEDLLDEGQAAARVAAEEVRESRPRRDVLKLCISALKRVLRLLKEVAQWALAKGDIFATEAAKSAGKVAGPAVAASALVAQLTGQLSELIDYLRSLAGL